VTSIDGITEFSRSLRSDLEGFAVISNLAVSLRMKSVDGTEKFLFGLEDGETIESVLIPDDDRLTLCVSSQVGCAMGCRFCLTGRLGLIRNLKAYEIIDQIITVNRTIGPTRRITNVVLMGMGEPLANFAEVVEALSRITSLFEISKRKITLSTAGLAPKIAELARSAPDINLAVSLNASSDKTRTALMPVNRRYPLRELLDACRRYPLGPRRRITFEYVLVRGMNDSSADARELLRIVRGIRCKVNLIPLNPSDGSGLMAPSHEDLLAFQKVLIDGNLTALIRESKGQDILAACGQLRAGHEV